MGRLDNFIATMQKKLVAQSNFKGFMDRTIQKIADRLNDDKKIDAQKYIDDPGKNKPKLR